VTAPHRIQPAAVFSIPLTTCVYALCAALLGVSLLPPSLLALAGLRALVLGPLRMGAAVPVGDVALYCLTLGGCVYAFFFCGLLVMGLSVRALSLAVKPGRYAAFAPTTIAWMILNSVHTIAFRVILPLVPAGYFSTMYFRVAGCRMGKAVWLTTASLLDPYLITIGDGSVIGGDAILSAHLFADGELFLAPIRIGRDCQIGAHALVCPGVTVGDGATVGIRAYLRPGRRVPAGARVSSPPPRAGGESFRSAPRAPAAHRIPR